MNKSIAESYNTWQIYGRTALSLDRVSVCQPRVRGLAMATYPETPI